MSAAPPFRLGHRPCLDGVRGIAVLPVLVLHLPLLPITGGSIGVDLFFVLSGFLITALLLEEWQDQGTIRLGRFYLRRALRLLPALVAVVAACLAASPFLESPVDQVRTRRMAAYALGYVANYSLTFGLPNNALLGHTWSLSVEEHFYLVWPLTLLLLLRAGVSRRRLAALLVAFIVLSAGLRIYYWLKDQEMVRAYFYTPARLDGVMVGSLLALLLEGGMAPKTPAARAFLKIGAVVALVCYVSFAVNGVVGPVYYFAGGALNAGLAILLASLVLTPIRPLQVLFENRLLTAIGKISYGLYLWHPWAYVMVRRFTGLRTEHQWIACLPAVLAVSAVSYLLVERPLLRLRSRLSSRDLPGVPGSGVHGVPRPDPTQAAGPS